MANPMNISASVEADNTDEVVDGINAAIARALETIGLVAEGYSKRICPVDTGRLRNSVTHEVSNGEKAVYIGTNVEYAPYVELGTSKHKAQPFLRAAALGHKSEYASILEAELKQ